MTPTWSTEDGRVQLYLGDCLDVLPTLDAGSVGAVVTDPPYGIGYVHSGKGAMPPGRLTCDRKSVAVIGDDTHFDPSPLLRFGNVLTWGANHYASRLPAGGRWLAWDKVCDMKVEDSFGDVDFAWHNKKGACRIVHYRWKGIACEKQGEHNGRRWHPMQKPVGVMRWSIEQSGAIDGATILDPFMGSGTTAIACIRMGRRFLGCEIDKTYFDIAVKRIEAELEQGRLFV